MQLAKEDFKQNLVKTLLEKVVDLDFDKIKFKVVPVLEANVNYNSTDEFIRMVMFNPKNIENRLFSIQEVVDFLVYPNEKYPRLFPLWVKIGMINPSNNFVFELKTSLRFRTCAQLKNLETGHPPFEM